MGAWTFGPMEFKDNIFLKAALTVVCYTAVFSVVKQRRDDSKNGCVETTLTGEIESPSGLSTQSLNNASKQKASNGNKPSTNIAGYQM